MPVDMLGGLKRPLLVVFLILLVDQIVKFWIKTHMMLGEEIHVFGNWFIIHFTENNGMAFGMQFGAETGKLLLTIFRILAAGLIGWYIWSLVKKNANKWLIICMALIFAGAFGNIIDCVFYGLIFNDSLYQVASFMPDTGGYGTLLHGKVVDMFYFPIIETHYPSWFPFWANEEFVFFRPVFNIADSAISVGVFLLIVFQKRFFKKNEAGIITEQVDPPKE